MHGLCKIYNKLEGLAIVTNHLKPHTFTQKTIQYISNLVHFSMYFKNIFMDSRTLYGIQMILYLLDTINDVYKNGIIWTIKKQFGIRKWNHLHNLQRFHFLPSSITIQGGPKSKLSIQYKYNEAIPTDIDFHFFSTCVKTFVG